MRNYRITNIRILLILLYSPILNRKKAYKEHTDTSTNFRHIFQVVFELFSNAITWEPHKCLEADEEVDRSNKCVNLLPMLH